MAIISLIRTKKFFFSIRWKFLIAFRLVLGVSFYFVATSSIELVGDYLLKTKAEQETATARDMADRFATLLARGDADTLLTETRQRARELNGRLLIIDMDGKVQVDTDTTSGLNGRRVAHPEVLNVLHGEESDFGFHFLSSTRAGESRAMFDFLRNTQTGREWIGYFTQALIYSDVRVGLLFYSVRIQPVVDTLRSLQDQMVFYFFLAAAAVIVLTVLFTRVITKPIAALTEGIKRMARGDLSGRVRVSGVDEMGRLAETFNQMSEKLEHLDMSRNEFVSNASHELKTPLATMKIMLQSMMFEENMDPALRQEFMGDIDKELDRLGQIVTDLLTLVRSDSNPFELSRKEIQLQELVRDTLRRLEPLAEQNGQTIDLRATADIPMYADPTKLQQVVYNLVDNALKYSPKGGKVKVVLRQEAKQAVLEVIDNGPGIPKKDQPHIFDRFYRVDKARSRATGGNGLGLSIVHQAVLQHGGSVTVHSEEGKGATFRVELPLQ